VRRRRLLLCVGAAACAALAVGLVSLLTPTREDDIPERLRSLKQDMTQREVEAVLGGPGRDWAYVTFGYLMSWDVEGTSVTLRFFGPQGEGRLAGGTIILDDSGRMEELPLGVEYTRSSEGVLGRLRRLLPW
jgi:hypothetical protein